MSGDERQVYAGPRFDLLVRFQGDEEKDEDATLVLVHDGNQSLVIPMREADELARLLASLPLLLALNRSAGKLHHDATEEEDEEALARYTGWFDRLLDGHVPPPARGS